MKISIVVPVYNVELYLKDCLESILTQNFDDYEIICVNDASTDGSLEILQDYAKKNNRINIINNLANGGLSYSRNCGTKNASGDYILFVDSDDMLCQGALAELAEEADRSKSDIIYFDMKIRDEGKWTEGNIKQSQNHSEYYGIYTGRELFTRMCEHNQFIVEACRQLFLKRFLKENDLCFYEGIVHEDILFSVICSMKAGKVSYINRKLYLYRRREGSISSLMNVHRMRSYFIVIIELWSFWHNNVFSAEVNEAFKNYLEALYYNFKKMKSYYTEVDTLAIGGVAEQFLFTVMTSDERQGFNYTHLSNSQLDRVKTAGKVIVYGAGTVGIEVIGLLRSENIKIDSVAVTNKDSNPDHVCGIGIEQIDQIADLDGAVIIVAVSEKYQGGVTDKLEKLGILENTIFINEKNM